MMNLHDLVWGVLWLVASACFALFIIFFDRKRYATPGMGFVYILFFFIAGLSLLLASLQGLR